MSSSAPRVRFIELPRPRTLITWVAVAMAIVVTGCASGRPVTIEITAIAPNVVTEWSRIAAETIGQRATPTGTPAERHPWVGQDLGLVHVAIYDAVVAIGGGEPFAMVPDTPTAGASQEAAAIAAAHAILQGLYPHRSPSYEADYATAIAALPPGEAVDKGIAVGTDVAAKWLARRGDDGRQATQPTYVPGTAPGQYRNTIAVARGLSSVRPLGLESADQFRLPPPIAMTSWTYATDVNEVEALGGTVSERRTPDQYEAAVFHTENPWVFWPRNLRQLGATPGPLVDKARLLAMLFVVAGDAEIACFDSKYVYQTWRPYSAIILADTDGNIATVADPAWTPVLPTPPHPEYPAAHACLAGAVAQALERFYGTDRVRFSFDSTATHSTHAYTTLQGLIDDVTIARIAGGMHFRSSLDAGVMQGRQVADWDLTRRFGFSKESPPFQARCASSTRSACSR